MVAMSVTRRTLGRGDAWLFPIGLATVLVACVFTPGWGNFPGKSAIPAVLGSALVLLAVHRGATGGWAAALLRSRVFVAIGLISYSLYLWHWPLLVLDAQLRMDPAPTSWRLGLCLGAVGLAWLSWRFVELPFRRRRESAVFTLSIGAGATALATALAVGATHVERVPEQARQMAAFARSDLPADMDRCHFDHDANVVRLPPASCASTPDQHPTVAIWGDSHALAWRPFAWQLAAGTGASAAPATMNSCRPTGLVPASSTGDQEAPCDRFNRLAMQWLESGEVQTLVIGLRWPLGELAEGGASAQMRRHIEGLDAALDRLGHVRRVLIMGPIPILRRPAPDCITLGWETACTWSRSVFETGSRDVWRELFLLAERHRNVELVDPVEFFCTEVRCQVARDGYALYWDGNHVSATAAREFGARYVHDPSRYTPAAAAAHSAH
jgi:hypothetical protein